MIALLAAPLMAAAGAAAAFGPSPLVAEGHQSDWATIAIDDPGEGWVDRAWHGADTLGGRPLRLVLVRMDLTDNDGMTLDTVMAVDCERQQIGIKEAWFFRSEFGNQTRAPIPAVTMDFHDTPLSMGDLAIIAHACTDAKAAQ
ncbi:hypothetical protein J3454_06300 [Erythrobacter sp. NFXS35]|uniref:hypothetical protein n=1 Tax=Erythrobacter sp. NFXS35 TaxID=2818436 RepID=UPI0032E053C8